MSKLETFQELATKAHEIEVMIANCCGNSFSCDDLKKDKAEFKRNITSSKNSTKEAMSTSKAKPIRNMKRLKLDDGIIASTCANTLSTKGAEKRG